MTQQTHWAATLAPVGRASWDNKTIDPECVITVSVGAPLLALDGTRIGEVTEASILELHVVATGVLDPGSTIPNATPTFQGGLHDRRTFCRSSGMTTFHTLTVTAVHTSFASVWSDPEIMFARDWCVHVLGPDDLVPMPDYATAYRATTRFNHCWQDYLPGTPAIVRPWPYDAENPNGHAEALAELRADDPEGWLR
jgi:hypothetical protein